LCRAITPRSPGCKFHDGSSVILKSVTFEESSDDLDGLAAKERPLFVYSVFCLSKNQQLNIDH
jgi:hypothetical protein